MNRIDRHAPAGSEPGAPLDPAEAAAAYLRAAVEAVDAVFGEGYARDNPALVASLVQASAIENAVNAGRAAHGEMLALVGRVSRETNETLLALKPRLFG